MRQPVEFKNFVGLDLRSLPNASAPGTLRECVNAHVTLGLELQSAPQPKLLAKVSDDSLGLYVVNNTLRCALQYPELGVDTVPNSPVNIVYDVLVDVTGQGVTLPAVQVASVAAWDNRPYLCVEVDATVGPKWRHYYISAAQAQGAGTVTAQAGDDLTIPGIDASVDVGATIAVFGSTAGPFRVTARLGDVFTVTPSPPVYTLPKAVVVWWPTRNRVNLPFEPGPAVATVAQKVVADDIKTRNTWYSSTVNGPTDWTALNDAGFIPSANHADGDQPIRGYGTYRGMLAIMYESVVQLWNMDPDPALITFEENVGGAGTTFPKSVDNVAGDLFYFSSGAFHRLDAAVLTGQPKDGDIGAPIQAETTALTPTNVCAVWSPRLQTYLCAIDGVVYVLLWSPTTGRAGWGRWELPWAVTDLVEWDQRIVVRRADAAEVWYLDEDNNPDVSWRVQFNFVDCGTSKTKRFSFADVRQTGECTATFGFDPDDATDTQEMFTLEGSTQNKGRVPVPCVTESLQVTFAGTGAWKLGSFGFLYDEMTWL